jgi:hypothetical protein
MKPSSILVGALAIAAACGDEPAPLVLGGGSTGAGGAVETNRGEEMFRALEAQLVDECGACHVIGGSADTPFLGDPETGNPDPYVAATSWPGLVVEDASDSVLVTWPASGNHTGPAATDALAAQLEAWLTEEAEAVDDTGDDPSPTLPPFRPIVPGFNAVYLDPLGPAFVGMAITFQAEELTSDVLSLTELELHPTTKKGLSLEHPLFTVYAPGTSEGDPDPVDSFSNVTQQIDAGESAPLGPGTLVLGNWTSGGKLSIAFQAIAVVDPLGNEGGGGGGGASGPCVALLAFEDNAAGPLTQSCRSCHGGNNATATNAVDMSDLGSDSAAACGQILNRVDLDDPPASQLFVTTNPGGNASHPFKFGGNQTAFNNFVSAVSAWIQAESP